MGDDNESDSSVWWLDLGATSHMTSVRQDFTRLESETPGSVTLADKCEIASVGKGDVCASLCRDF